MSDKRATVLAYTGIISVVLIWGVIPTVKSAVIGDGAVSGALYSAITAFSAACALLLFSLRRLKEYNLSYLKVALPTGLVLGTAALLQALAYQFEDASPTKQAFLENLSCITVPILLFILIKKKPTVLTVLSSLICLASALVLADVFTVGLSLGTSDIFNATAGILYGVNIAVTGVFAKKFNASLYVMTQLFTQSFISLLIAISFNLIKVDGKPIDPIVFTPDVWFVLALIGIGVVSNAICWTVRTNAMKYVSANVVAVIMPFSAVVTGIVSVIAGKDTLGYALVIGAVLGLVASFMSSANDIKENRKMKLSATQDPKDGTDDTTVSAE